jgi:eukaryotic-like serine/threonine-protein kinase
VVEEPAAARRVDVVEEEEAPPPRPPLLWPWLLLLMLLVLAGLGAWWFLSRDEEKRAVPDLVGLREPEARARLAAEDLRVEVDRRPNERPRGVVYAQTPGAGAQVDENEVVEVEVSAGPPDVVVPQVVNVTQEQAEARLREAELEPVVRRVFAEDPPGTVVAQDPPGGERAPTGSDVRINVSRGTGRVEVPDVAGVARAVAEQRLTNAGLEARAFEVPSAEPEGTVVAQNPVPGKQVAQGDSVRINVSSGTPPPAGGGAGGGGAQPARVVVPDVVGATQVAAQQQLQRAGFGATVGFVPSQEPAGVVAAQNPAGGTQARRGSYVHINVSEGPQPQQRQQVPDVTGLDEQAARQDLQQAGFRVQVFPEPTPDPAEAGTVIRQEPSAGTRAPRGALVTIYVGEFTGD